ncbi:MAG: hypothetical protein E7535_03065 [Ruminococcaceae bacterium]|nr:hypothetical protein [Oscillospiraceae bacterium]
MTNKRISIEAFSILKDLIKNFWIVILVVLIAKMGVYISMHSVYLPEYTSTATMIVTAKGSGTASYGNYTLSSDLAKIFANIFTDPVIKTKASEYLDESFDGRISAKASNGTNFISLSVTSDNPIRAYELLNAVLATYPQVSDYVFDNATVMLLKPPSVPVGPSNAISDDNVALIESGCAIVAVFLIVALSVLRDTVKNENSFNDKIGAKLLGSIKHERKHMKLSEIIKRKKRSLRIYANAFVSFSFVESFYKIAAKIEYINRKSGDKVFVVTSVAENEGKSTVASNIAIALASKGKKVVLMDFDFKKPAIHKIFEIEDLSNSELGMLFEGKITKSDFNFIKYKKLPLMLAVNTSPYKDSSKWLDRGLLEQFVKSIAGLVDYVIIDTPPCHADSGVSGIVRFADKLIMVTRTDVVKTDIINKSIKTLTDAGADIAGCVLNDLYPDFAPAEFFGVDESGDYYKAGYGKYSKYGKYGKYNKYGKYSRYSKYSESRSGYYNYSHNVSEE